LDLILWQFIRASGLFAILLLTVSVIAGILVKTRAADQVVRRAWTHEAHQSLSFASLGLVALHVILILFNSHVPFDVASALVPFITTWKPLPTALGILGLYLMVALTVSTYARNIIGQKAWRMLHYASFLAWLAAILHGVSAGSDTGLPAVQWLYWVLAGSVVLATTYRILLPLPPKPAMPMRPLTGSQ
jgi:predicted ferric reductase